MSFNSSENGQPVKISWNKHQLDNSEITHYSIWRKVTTQGTPQQIETVIATGASTYEYIDYDYIVWDGDGRILLFYDVRAYYSPSSTYSDPDLAALYGAEYKINQDNKIQYVANNESGDIPAEYGISNFPNPFNPTTVISYQLPENGFVTLKVYDLLGKEVAVLINESKYAGYYNVEFDAGKLTSGIYIYTIQAGNFLQSKKMLLLK